MPQLVQKVVQAPVDSLTLHPDNPRTGNVEAIKASIEANGQFAPIVVQKSTKHVLSGNHTLLAVRELGWEKIPAVFVDVDDEHARRILLAANRTHDLGSYDDDQLRDLLASLDTFEGTGYGQEDLDELLKVTGQLAEQATDFLTPFSHAAPAPAAGAPAAAAPGAPATPGQDDAPSGPVFTGPPNPIHTGPAPYAGPGAPAPAGQGAQLPPPPALAALQWVVTLPQRETIRAALRHAQDTNGLETGAEALHRVAVTYLAAVGVEDPSAAPGGSQDAPETSSDKSDDTGSEKPANA
ncbi:ParB/RepB/Spo0J family partition protein [Streptomyces chilikensis]|uniref:ParB/RepB/Spo0J family partition protein n=1 Tax=Streptomyces chilikensis TaxID=1194079 RepID=A0ABV3EJ71_9ACTN